VIDPRFPLFQQALASPKKSHESLAKLLGAPELVRDSDPKPEDFSDLLIETVAANWAAFNDGYTEEAQKSFDKYAKRLNEEIAPQNRRAPSFVIPPYLIARVGQPGWWKVSRKVFEASRNHVSSDRLVHAVATEYVGTLDSQLADAEHPRIAVWVSGLNELTANSSDLAGYGNAIRTASDDGKQIFALYGGFFSVLLRQVGLRGSSHGIGFGESRTWVELPQSGPPPARYYLPSIHRYVSQDIAYQLWVRDRDLGGCECRLCQGNSPLSLGYQELMEHSVLCRSREIEGWATLSLDGSRQRLTEQLHRFRNSIEHMTIPVGLRNQLRRSAEHLQAWIDALAQMA
jgi:hypothetical protein